ncbi:MAG: hypothetical protein JWO42_2094, partial [Chloroflexi bacterium]|nr:hypothetical protein [Chloroflexota bacterium]
IALLALIFMRDQVRLVLHEQTSQSPPDEQMQSAQPE